MILKFHEYKQVWCYQTDFRPVRKELEGEKRKSGKETEKGPDGSGRRRKGDEGKSMGAGGGEKMY